MIAFIDDHREIYGVEPICKVLPIAPSTLALLRGGRVRYAGMGRLVQQSPALVAHRQHPAG